MVENLLVTAQEAVALAQKLGAEAAFASVSRERSTGFDVRDGVIEKVTESTARRLSFRLWVEGRYSTQSTSDLRPAAVEAFVKEGVAMTRALQADPHRVLPDPALYAGRADVNLELVDPAVLGLDRDQRLALVRELDALVSGQPGMVSTTSSVSDDHGQGASASSNGFAGQWEATSMWLSTNLTLADGDKLAEDGSYAGGHHRSVVPSAKTIADDALRRVRARAGTTKGPTRKTTMVVDPRAAGSLISRLLGPASGGPLSQGRSFWKDKLDQVVISKVLEIVDDPLIPRGLGSRHFDGEGVAARKRTLVEGGALRAYWIDSYYGHKLGLPVTSGGPSNRIVTPGKRGLDAIVGAVSDGIYVTSWLGGNADATTGDFSLGARGHLITKGKLGAPVGELNVTGNLLTLFGQLVEVGDDPWRYSATLCPTLVFDKVDFAGA